MTTSRFSGETDSLMGRIISHRITAGSGPRVLVVAGQHGDEGLAITAASALARVIVPRRGTIEIIPCLNPAAAAAGERYAPPETGLDEAVRQVPGAAPRSSGSTDLNRCWSGGREREAHHAREVMAGILISEPDLVLDLHVTTDRRRPGPTAWVYAPTAELAAQFVPGVPAEVVPHDGTLMQAITRVGVPCLTVEVDDDALTRGEAMRAFLWVVVRACASIGLSFDVQWASWRWR
jgi:predicted deacylase